MPSRLIKLVSTYAFTWLKLSGSKTFAKGVKDSAKYAILNVEQSKSLVCESWNPKMQFSQ